MAYTKLPDHLAWSGWRLRIPGGPHGGQYHGFIAPDSSYGSWPAGRSEIGYEPDQWESSSGPSVPPGAGSSAGPWSPNWGGTALKEGEDHSDYVYRSTAEMRPRPNASGGAHVVRGMQRRKSAGYAVAPGNYRGLGAMMYDGAGLAPGYSIAPRPIAPVRPALPAPSPIGPAYPIVGTTFYSPPSYGPPSPIRYLGPPLQAPGSTGATAIVSQPPPPGYPVSSPAVPIWSAPPISPAPSPTVDALPSDYLPSQGQYVPGVTPILPTTTPSPVLDWLQSDTIITGVPNWIIAAGGAFALMSFSQGRAGGRR